MDSHRRNPDGSVTLITESGGEHTYDPEQVWSDDHWDLLEVLPTVGTGREATLDSPVTKR